MWQTALQKAVFHAAKGHVLRRKTWPFRFIRSSGVCVEIKTEVAVKVVYLWLQQKTKHDEQHIPVSSTHGVSDSPCHRNTPQRLFP